MLPLLLLLSGCLYVDDDAHNLRKDADQDGVLEPDDCDDTDGEVGVPGVWHLDADGDGYGDDGDSMAACDAPDGYAPVDGDCVDTDATIFPDAPELCDGSDNDCDGETPADEVDVDADGFLICDGDCDDADAALNPDATEVCNGIDDDCDAEVPADEADDDTDGFRICEGDCDDANADARPDGTEVCDDADVDEDCDGLADDLDAEGATGKVTRYLDADLDGFAVDDVSAEFCEVPADHIELGSIDCDDARDDANPGVVPETCRDFTDNNCNGSFDQCVLAGVGDLDDFAEMRGGRVEERFGTMLTTVGDWTGDGNPELLVISRHDVPATGVGALYMVSWPFDDESVVADVASHTFIGNYTNWSLDNAVAIGDQDADGVEDFAAYSPKFNGEVYLMLSGSVSPGASNIVDRPTILGSNSDDRMGAGLAAVDIDVADPGVDLIIGSIWRDPAGLQNAGMVHVLRGPVTSGLADVDSAQTRISGTTDASWLGQSFATGDFDGDGVGDFAAGAPSEAGTGDPGHMYFFADQVIADLDDTDATSVMAGPHAESRFAWRAAGLGDIDGDGLDDMVVGATQYATDGATHTGAALVIAGRASWPATLDMATDATATLEGARDQDLVGFAVGAGGDINNDGFADILVGGRGWDKTTLAPNQGAAFVLLGPQSGKSAIDAAAASIVYGEHPNSLMGFAVAGADFNGDGFSDYAIGAPAYNFALSGQGSVSIGLGIGL